jgi:hypothetical protein
MARRLSYIAVEGPQDVEFIARLLKGAGFSHVKMKPEVEAAFAPLTDLKFPVGDDLTKRMPVPSFYQTADHAVAVHSSEGESRLAKNTIESLDATKGQVEAVGFVMDDDKNPDPASRLSELREQLGKQSKPAPFMLPQSLGLIQPGPPRSGVYVLPDNLGQGTLEDILLECAGINYRHAACDAGNFIKNLDRTKLATSEQKLLASGSNEKKAHVGALVSVLRPGKTTQVSIHDNRWLEGDSLNLPLVLAVRSFLRDLLNEPSI